MAARAGGGLASKFAFSTAFEGTFAGLDQVGRNLINGERWNQGVGGSILSSIVFQGASEALSNRRQVLQAGRRLLRGADNLADDVLRVFRGRRLATANGADILPSSGNDISVQSNRPLASSTDGVGGGSSGRSSNTNADGSGDGPSRGASGDTSKFRDFFHGSSKESIDNIVKNGLDTKAARRNSGGGRVNKPGSFFTIETSEDKAIQLAYEFALARIFKRSDARILVIQFPDSIFRNLESSNLIEIRPIAGVETTRETIFKPESFDIFNQVARFTQIIDPHSGR